MPKQRREMTKDKIKLFVVDLDSIYRLGLRTALANYLDLEIIGEGDFSNDTWRQLTQGLVLNILIIGLDNPTKTADGEFCQQIAQLYPQLPIFVLTGDFSPKTLSQMRSWGIKGYCDRHSGIDTIVDGLYTVAYGNTYLQKSPSTRPRFWQRVLSRISKSGRLELAEEIERIHSQLQNPHLSDWEKVFLFGRKRELTTARWLSDRLVSESIDITEESPQATLGSKLVPIASTELVPLPEFEDSEHQQIFERVVTDLQIGLVNRSKIPLEIDILKPEISRALCHLLLKRLSETVKQIPIANTLDRDYISYLQDIWSWGIGEFFDRYYGALAPEEQEKLERVINFEFIAVEENIFQYIYGVPELLEYLLGKSELVIDNTIYQSDDPEAIARIEFLLHNLVINLANSVMVVILNNFYNLEIFKSKLYQAEYQSDRQLASFRNQLAWRYRQEKYIEHPRNIFESRHRILAINNGIRTSFIYASRKTELEELSGIPWFTTIAIEFRDAVAPLVREIIALAGSGVVFMLTQVVGKSLGLIAKGIIQGIGSSIKDIDRRK